MLVHVNLGFLYSIFFFKNLVSIIWPSQDCRTLSAKIQVICIMNCFNSHFIFFLLRMEYKHYQNTEIMEESGAFSRTLPEEHSSVRTVHNMLVNEDWFKSYLVPFPEAGAKHFNIWCDTNITFCCLCSHPSSASSFCWLMFFHHYHRSMPSQTGKDRMVSPTPVVFNLPRTVGLENLPCDVKVFFWG